MSKTRLRVGHASLQFSDTEKQKEEDVITIFEHAQSRDYWWITGTEATGRRAGSNDKASAFFLRKYARSYGYYFFMEPRNDSWILIKMDRVDWINSTKNYFYRKVLPGVAKQHGQKGVITKTFTNNAIGTVTVGAGHYVTKGNPYAKDPARRVRVGKNRRLANRFRTRLNRMAKGKKLSFFGADVNIGGSKNQPNNSLIPEMITCWEEVGRWPGTGHGNIDFIARHRRDRRVECVSARVFRDDELHLNTDHFLVEATYEIENL